MAVTVADVARHAGVSTATVSYVLSGKEGHRISAATRELVRTAAAELGYQPNTAARSLRTGRGSAVLLPLPGLRANHVLGQMIDLCTVSLAGHQLSLITDFTPYSETEHAVRAWARLGPAAVVDLVLPRESPMKQALAKSGLNVINPAQTGIAPGLSPADAAAGDARMTQLGYLADRGHQNIVFALAPPAERQLDKVLHDKLHNLADARRATLSTHRLSLTATDVESFVTGWITSPNATAVAAFNDDCALALIAAFQSRGVRVPDDVAVMGVDDIPLAAAFTPGLTTIAADFTELAATLTEFVVKAVETGELSGPLAAPGHRVRRRQSA
ncbi:LacI family DNA-binding transcriptional regulator [Actinoplanes sp. LDG1-06]|uniref:LacI family DNA-binding transcriptional regulator n=1 Tax=Paractinoplanes ovalisporus TaxID=2810368 RepID=A0ABS2AVJ4_9ACTN|nr:LacI family DNA-binding transcriptional regulator [Actinoplanes ovalisporus]MBM2623894.1 LacI family DNA-binding transcriptional regulator [Actinoplanes ovalisporus]